MKNKDRNNKNKGSFGGLYVKVYHNNIEQAIKIFKQRVKDSGLMMDIKNNEHYVKPSEERRTKKKLGIVRQRVRQSRLD